MKSKISGIPLALIGVLLAFAAIVITPMFLLHSTVMKELDTVKNISVGNTKGIVELRNIILTPSPTATPEATITPKLQKTTTNKSATTSSQPE